MADNVVILRNLLEEERRRRTVEILKFRGAPHQRGEFPFTITARDGILVIPLSAIELTQSSSTGAHHLRGSPSWTRCASGGFFRDSVVLVSGATGTGKTLMVTQFMAGGFRRGRALAPLRLRGEPRPALPQRRAVGDRLRAHGGARGGCGW